jgi:ferric-dicitrate binding protein FerR (iron transport regulator)
MNSKDATHTHKKFILSFISVLLVIAASFLIYIIPHPTTTRLYETASEQYLTIKVTPEITIDLDTNSSVAVKKDDSIQIELLRGEAYFDVHSTQENGDKLEIILGNARIRNTGTRFSIRRQKNGGDIAIAEGQIELQIGTQTLAIGAGRLINFDTTRIINEAIIASSEIAPWRQQK